MKYQGRDEAASGQTADLYRRMNRVETTRPVIGYQTVTAADYTTPPLSLTSTSFITLAYLWPEGERPGIEAYLRVVTPGGVTMEIRLVSLGGAVVYSPVATIPASTNGFQGVRGRISAGNLVAAELQARVASGAGTCRVGVLKVIGGNYSSELFS